VAARLQTSQSVQGVTFQVFVAGLATDPELLTQIRDRESIGLRQHNEANSLFHLGYILPRHSGAMCNPSSRIECYLSSRFIPIRDNHLGTVALVLPAPVRTRRLVLELTPPAGGAPAALFAVRAYTA
jgi:hypothetical protein